VPKFVKLYDALYLRVLAKVVKPEETNENGCWLFTGALDKDGYGTISRRVPGVRNPRHRRVHLIMWEEAHGPVPEGMTLDHLDCIAKACCNPGHLELVTRAVNSARRWKPRYAMQT
jgi:hypothetical protein